MSEIKYEYHLSLTLQFYKDIDLDALEKSIGLDVKMKISLKDSVAINGKKTAKLWIKSKEFSEINTDEVLDKYVNDLAKRLENLPEIFKEYNGEGGLQLVFTSTNERPIIWLNPETMMSLGKLNLSFSVDFI